MIVIIQANRTTFSFIICSPGLKSKAARRPVSIRCPIVSTIFHISCQREGEVSLMIFFRNLSIFLSSKFRSLMTFSCPNAPILGFVYMGQLMRCSTVSMVSQPVRERIVALQLHFRVIHWKPFSKLRIFKFSLNSIRRCFCAMRVVSPASNGDILGPRATIEGCYC